jgi:hypothetical protein
MTAREYAQNAARENGLGLHYSGLTGLTPCKSITCAEKNPGARVESAKLG